VSRRVLLRARYVALYAIATALFLPGSVITLAGGALRLLAWHREDHA
jgi:uncharacterized membrane protein YdjX (TVP38/TMEM64 family)